MTGFILMLLEAAYNLVHAIFPNMDAVNAFFDSASSNFDMVLDFLENVNFIIPLPTIMIILGIDFGYHIALFAIFFTDKVRRIATSFIP